MWMIAIGMVKSFFAKKAMKAAGSAIAGNWKPILAVVLVGLVYWQGTRAWSNYKAGVAEQARVVRQLSLDKQAAMVEAESSKATIKQMIENKKLVVRLLGEARDEQDVIRAEAQAQMDAFVRLDGTAHDLEKAANRHGEWVGKLATNASNKIMQELQDEINH